MDLACAQHSLALVLRRARRTRSHAAEGAPQTDHGAALGGAWSDLPPPTFVTPLPALLLLCIPEDSRLHLRSCCSSSVQRIRLLVDPEVSGSRESCPFSRNVDDKCIEWRHSPFPAAEVKARHEQRYKLRLSAKVKVLRRRQASGVKDSRI